MSNTTLCCLCVSYSTEFKIVFDDSGQLNRIYQIAVKYFDPILLNRGYNHPNVICVKCWQHIENFHRFQLSVLNSQAQLKFLEPNISLAGQEYDILNNINDAEQILPNTSLTVSDIRHIDDITSDKQFDSAAAGFKHCTSNVSQEPPVTAVLASKIQQIEDIPTNTQINADTLLPPANSISSQATTLSVFELIQIDDKPSCANPNKRERKIENDAFIAKWKGELKCLVCKRKFTTYTLLTKHFRIEHQAIKCYTVCCGIKISYRSNLVSHIQKMHMPRPLNIKTCRFCKATFADADQLSKHKDMECRKNGTYNCKICTAIFSKEIALRAHYRMQHKKYPLPTYICTHCNKILKTHYTFERHLKKMHPEETVDKGEEAQVLSVDFTSDMKAENQKDTELINLNNNSVDSCQTSSSEDLREFLTDDEEDIQNKQITLPKLVYLTNQIQSNEEKTKCSIKSITNETNRDSFKESLANSYPICTQNIKENIFVYSSDVIL